jgi:hypothetical protein
MSLVKKDFKFDGVGVGGLAPWSLPAPSPLELTPADDVHAHHHHHHHHHHHSPPFTTHTTTMETDWCLTSVVRLSSLHAQGTYSPVDQYASQSMTRRPTFRRRPRSRDTRAILNRTCTEGRVASMSPSSAVVVMPRTMGLRS